MGVTDMTCFRMKMTALAAVLAMSAAGAADAAPAVTGQVPQMHMGDSSVQDKRAEIQLDYLEHRGERRSIDLCTSSASTRRCTPCPSTGD